MTNLSNENKTNENLENETFDEWLDRGIRKQFCTEIYCSTHESYAEGDAKYHEKQFDEHGFDYCAMVVRVK